MSEPITVLVCGDRYSDTSFPTAKKFITTELKLLPRDSIVVHGGCYGIDNLAGSIAKSLGLQTKIYPAEWNKYGRAAGPIRNKQMLVSENPTLVLAFHPNIKDSKGTKNMITQAYKYRDPNTGEDPSIYICSPTGKTQFTGSFLQD